MSSSLTRLDVCEWTAHREDPAAVDASKDRRARWYFAFSEVLGWLMLPFSGIFLIPAMNGVPMPPLVLIAVCLVMPLAVLVAVLRFRALRKITGAPILADVQGVIEATAEIFAYQRACFREVLEAPDIDRATRAELRKEEEQWSKSVWQLRRTLLRHCELAALAQRYGWTRTRDRQARKIVEMCSIVCNGFLESTESERASGNLE